MNLVRKLFGALTYLSPLEPQAAELWYHGHNDLEAGLLAASPGHRTPGRLPRINRRSRGFWSRRRTPS